MKTTLPLIALALACAACAGEPAPQRSAVTETVATAAPGPVELGSRRDVTFDGKGNVTATRPVAAEPAQPPAPVPATPRSIPEAPRPESTRQPNARLVTPDELRPMLERGEAVLVDVRSESAWAFRRAEGAMNIPYQDLFARSVELPHEKLIALYCT